jgi:hypothetical protein
MHGLSNKIPVPNDLTTHDAKPRGDDQKKDIDLKLITGQRLLRFSILKETPTPRQNGKMVFGQE